MSAHPDPLDLEAFLAWEQHEERKHEFADGATFAMSGASDAHVQIVANVVALVRPALRGTACRGYASDMKVVTPRATARYPDFLVTCDERDAGNPLVKAHPKLIVEVLSPSTASTDLGEKLDEYQSIPELEEYVLIDSRKRSLRVFRRSGENLETEPPIFVGSLALRSLGISLTLDAIYEDVGIEGGA